MTPAESAERRDQTVNPPFTLRNTLSFDTVDCLHHLSKPLNAATSSSRLDRYVQGSTYQVDAYGEGRRSIAFAPGMVADLDDHLRSIRDDPAEYEKED